MAQQEKAITLSTMRVVLLLGLLLAGGAAFAPSLGAECRSLRTRREAAGGNTRKKKSGGGGGMGKPGAAAAPKKKTANWLPASGVAESTVAVGGSKAVDIDGEKDPLIVVRSSEGWHGLQAACGRCQYPLLNGEVIHGGEASGWVITCAACGETYGLATGQPCGKVESGGNFLRGIVSGVTASKPAKTVTTWNARAAEDGSVFVDALSKRN